MPKKKQNPIIDKRYDVVVTFEVKNGNPNGEPDNGNAPRQDLDGYGKVSPQSIKRKIRNTLKALDHRIVVDADGPVLEETYNAALKASGKAQDGRTNLCEGFIDARLFGAVVTGAQQKAPAKAPGEIHGPVQFSWSESIDPIQPQQMGLTRCIGAARKEDSETGRMGSNWIVPYALYRTHVYISPMHAKRAGNGNAKFTGTGMTQADLDEFFRALLMCFEHDRSATRGEMRIRNVLVYEHDSALGNAPAGDLFDCVDIVKRADVDSPRRFKDYDIRIQPHQEEGVQLYSLKLKGDEVVWQEV